MLIKYCVLGVGLLFLTLPNVARAQGPQAPTPEKAALIKELLEATHMQESLKSIMETMGQQAEELQEELFAQILAEEPGLSEDERQEALVKMRINREVRLKRYNELLAQRIDLPKFLEEISYELYDRYFSEEDLRNLVSFYKSATGQKSIAVMPQLFSDSMRKTSERLLPVVREISTQIAKEQQQELETNRKPGAPPARRRSPRRGRKP